MTIEEIKTSDIETIEARSAEILAMEVTEETSTEDIEARASEMEAIEERKAEIIRAAKEAEEQRAFAAEEGEVIKEIFQEERKMKTIEEFRNSAEYVNAYAEYIKTGKEEELRSLLTENVDNGTIAVPDLVYDTIKTAWDKNELLAYVKKVSVKGNLKVQFEISGTDAVIHTEGSGAVDEETLTEGIVTMVPAFVKKWISISDEVLALRGDAFLTYIYSELTMKITKKIADTLVGQVAALSTSASATAPAAAKITVAPAMDTVAQAIGNLSDEASAPIIVMNKLTWAEFKAVQYANNYGVDPFEGLKVVFNNTLPAYSSASANAVYMIVGDFNQGALANFPEGESVRFVFDDKTLATSDLVKVIGKEYMAVAPVANKAFVNVAKPASV